MLIAKNLSIVTQNHPLLKHQNFQIKTGEIIGIFGGPGSGKSAFLKVLLGLWKAKTGEISFQEKPLSDESRHQMGYLPQHWGFDPDETVEEFLAHYASLFRLTHFEETLPSILELLDLKKQQQLPLKFLESKKLVWLGIARVLIAGPDLLMLDEPFNQLEEAKTKEFSAILKEMASMKHAIIITSNSLDVLEPLCNEILFLANGKFQDKEVFNYTKHLLQKFYFRLSPKASYEDKVSEKLSSSLKIQKLYQVGSEFLGNYQSSSSSQALKELKSLIGPDADSIKEWKRTPEVALAELKQAWFLYFEIETTKANHLPIYELLNQEKLIRDLAQQEQKITGTIQGYEGKKLLEDSLLFKEFENYSIHWSFRDDYYH